ncbi:unknown protein [Cronobacter turicensis z3032]|uniref:Uncharacterized protein n=1 Tax=Cronobacter turicensis (strain DSM 18703 / CCUG 55852 / LMG 23827 / z3032) TaxID=693216 RepID=C9Y1M5_CROTZ|nr:unknown protein [Cronobacter turicensis z3032]
MNEFLISLKYRYIIKKSLILAHLFILLEETIPKKLFFIKVEGFELTLIIAFIYPLLPFVVGN